MLKNPIFKSTILQVLQAVTQSRHLREDAEVCKQLDQIGVATQLTDETFESNRSAHGNGRMDLSDDEADEENADEGDDENAEEEDEENVEEEEELKEQSNATPHFHRQARGH